MILFYVREHPNAQLALILVSNVSEDWATALSENGDKDQESIQPSTTPDLGYHMEK